MPRFIAVHPVALKDEELIALLARRDELPPSVVWRNAFVAEDDGVMFCEWETPYGYVLKEVFEIYGIPYTAIHEVRVFEPAAHMTKAA